MTENHVLSGTRCEYCDEPLPDITDDWLVSDEQYFGFEGYCNAKCAALSLAKEAREWCDKNMRTCASIECTPEFMLRIANAIP